MLKKWFSKIHDKMVFYANSKYAIYILILVAFTESSFFLLPPDILLILMAISIPQKALLYALITTISSVLGGVFGYFLGYFTYDSFLNALINSFGYEHKFEAFKSFYLQYDIFAIFIAGFTPIPYKIATISSGIFKANLVSFIVVSFLSRGLRFFILAFLIKNYYESGKELISKHFNKIILISSLLLIILVVLFVYFYRGV
jgi:membrane protein YqaA with SNARE-associated domain